MNRRARQVLTVALVLAWLAALTALWHTLWLGFGWDVDAASVVTTVVGVATGILLGRPTAQLWPPRARR